jgi:steroid 5-alpha reductase family enzyme
MMTVFMPVVMVSAVFLAGTLTLLAGLAARLKNAGIVDVFWGLGFIPLAFIAAGEMESFWLRKMLLLSMVTLGSLRLGLYLLKRAVQLHPVEDPRYHALRLLWGKNANWGFWGVFLFQGLLMLLLSGIFWVPLHNPHSGIQPLEWLGVTLWLVGYMGEGLADSQLASFKRKTESHGQICLVGLWRYSRHPNYFFEWVQWLGYFVFAFSSPLGGWTAYAPLLMLFLLTKVSGIPPTEAHLLASKGAAYQHYQQTTSAFVPWFPRRDVPQSAKT